MSTGDVKVIVTQGSEVTVKEESGDITIITRQSEDKRSPKKHLYKQLLYLPISLLVDNQEKLVVLILTILSML